MQRVLLTAHPMLDNATPSTRLPQLIIADGTTRGRRSGLPVEFRANRGGGRPAARRMTTGGR